MRGAGYPTSATAQDSYFPLQHLVAAPGYQTWWTLARRQPRNSYVCRLLAIPLFCQTVIAKITLLSFFGAQNCIHVSLPIPGLS